MKFSKTSKILLIAGVLLIVFASLGFAGSQQLAQQEKLNEDLQVAQQRVSTLQMEQLNGQQTQLNQQIAQANTQIKSAAAVLKQPIDSVSVTAQLFQIAANAGVTITSINAAGLSQDDVEKVKCSAQKLTVEINGERDSLIAFVTALNTDFTTGVVQAADISVPTTEDKAPSASVQLAVYSYGG
jgi:hypothetical protein